jgi:hypothetical protein
MVPIPEGVETSYEEPEDEDFSGISQSDGGGSSKIKRPSTSSSNTNSSLGNSNVDNSDGSTKSYSSKIPNLDEILRLKRFSLNGRGKEDDELRG